MMTTILAIFKIQPVVDAKWLVFKISPQNKLSLKTKEAVTSENFLDVFLLMFEPTIGLAKICRTKHECIINCYRDLC